MAHVQNTYKGQVLQVMNRRGPALPVAAGERVYVLILNEKTERYEVKDATMWGPWLLPMDEAHVRINGVKVRVSASRVYATHRQAAGDRNVWNKWIEELPAPITKPTPKFKSYHAR